MYLEKQADMPVRYNTYVTSRDYLCKNLAKKRPHTGITMK